LEDTYLVRITARWELLQQVEDDVEDVEDQHHNTKALRHLPLHAHDRSNHCAKHKDQQKDGTGNALRTLSTEVKWLAIDYGIEESEAAKSVDVDATTPATAWDVAVVVLVVVRLVTVDLAAVVVVLMTVVIVIVAFVVLVVVDIVVVVAAFVVLVVVDLVLVVRTVVVVGAAVVVLGAVFVVVVALVVVIAFVIVVAFVAFEVRVALVVPTKWFVEPVFPRLACLVRVLADAKAVMEAAVLATVGFVIAETVVPAVSSTA